MINEFANAKINLTLEVLGRRSDGYHELRSLVVFASFGDALTYVPGGPLRLETTGPFASAVDGENLVLKAARALLALDAGFHQGLFRLDKRIPVAAGLGGGSSDAAAALRALLQEAGRPFIGPATAMLSERQEAPSPEQLTALAAKIGADVPVCLWRKAAVMGGVGEKLTFMTDFPSLPAVLVNPGVKLSTRDVFAELGAPVLAGDGNEAASERELAPPLDESGLMCYLAERGNDLEAPARRLAPVIDDVFSALKGKRGCVLTRLSGSGPTCFGLFASMEEAEAAARDIVAECPRWWAAATRLG